MIKKTIYTQRLFAILKKWCKESSTLEGEEILIKGKSTKAVEKKSQKKLDRYEYDLLVVNVWWYEIWQRGFQLLALNALIELSKKIVKRINFYPF